jgi:hypothetical protein
MSEREKINLDLDPMLFMQAAVDEQLAMLGSLDLAAAMGGGMPGMFGILDAMSEVGTEKIVEAQTALDTLVENDPTWRAL